MLLTSVWTLLVAYTLATKSPHIVCHDDSFVPDAALQVTAGTVEVGCIERYSVLVNGTIPGPDLRFKEGERVWIRVYNEIPESNLTIHWHGLSQAAAPFADGTPQASQWPIPPGHFFDYELALSKVEAGTYFYHSHVGFQAQTAHGALIIEDADVPPYPYVEERIISFSDLYNKTDHEIEAGLIGAPFKWSGETGAVLVNGKGISNYTATNHAANCAFETIHVEPSKDYRFRWIGTTAISYVALAIEGHPNMTVIEADGAYTQPHEVSFLQIATGQRFSTFLHTKSCEELQGKHQYYIQLETRDRPANLTTFAILDYGDSCEESSPPSYTAPLSTTSNPTKPPLTLPPITNTFLEYALQPLVPNNFPTAADVTRRVTVRVFQPTIDTRTTWQFNNESWTEHTATQPYLVALYQDTASHLPNYTTALANSGVDPSVDAWPARLGEVLEVVVQNTANAAGSTDFHPMHMHGAHFYDIGAGEGSYDAAANEVRLASYRPARRDTVLLHRYAASRAPGAADSWRAWRLRVDEPGVWMLHCHILQHMVMGMQSVWVFGDAEDVMRVPRPMVEGYLTYGGDVYGTAGRAPNVVHWFDEE